MKKLTLLALFFTALSLRNQEQTVTDRDSNVYHTVTIGTQVWMRENLKSLHYSDSSAISYTWSYNHSDSMAGIYGRLYSWDAAMHGAAASNSIPSGVQGVCPEGWHLPSSAEWGILIDFYGGEMEAGAMLKESDTTHWTPPNTGATNKSGFAALPGGSWGESGGGLIGESGFWWTSRNDYGYVYIVVMGNETPYAFQMGEYIAPGDNSGGYSVRCLKNTVATQIALNDKFQPFSMYPNPATDWIMIRIEDNQDMELSIYGIEGNSILQKHLINQETLVDISSLSEGIYIISVKSSHGTMQKKLVKSSGSSATIVR